MPKFRKCPIVIEADQWFKNGDHPQDEVGEIVTPVIGSPYPRREGAIVRFYRTPGMDGETLCKHCCIRMHEHGWIDTLEGGHIVCPSDWVITGVAGEMYPCKDAVFQVTYEPVG